MHVTLDEMVCSDCINMLVLVDTGTRMEISIFINLFPTESIDSELFRTNLRNRFENSNFCVLTY